MWRQQVEATFRRDHSVLRIGSRLLLTMGGNFYDSIASRDSLIFYEFTRFNDGNSLNQNNFSSLTKINSIEILWNLTYFK